MPKSPTPPYQTTTVPNHQGSTPDLIRFANSAEGLLFQGDISSLRRFVMEAPSKQDQSRRQQDLMESATAGLAMWPGYAPPGGDPLEKPVVRARLLGWPFLISSSGELAIRPLLEWKGDNSRGVRQRVQETFASALQTHPNNVSVLGAVHCRNIASVSPLSVHYAFKQARMAVSDCQQESGPPRGSTERSPLGLLLQGADDQEHRIGRCAPGTYILIALVASEWDDPGFQAVQHSPRVAVAMRELLQPLLAYSPPPGKSIHADDQQAVLPTVQMGAIKRLDESISDAQGMELSWFAKLARRRGLQFDIFFDRIFSLARWTAALVDEEGDTELSFECCYDDTWRPHEHIDLISDFVAEADAKHRLNSQPLRAAC